MHQNKHWVWKIVSISFQVLHFRDKNIKNVFLNNSFYFKWCIFTTKISNVFWNNSCLKPEDDSEWNFKATFRSKQTFRHKLRDIIYIPFIFQRFEGRDCCFSLNTEELERYGGQNKKGDGEVFFHEIKTRRRRGFGVWVGASIENSFSIGLTMGDKPIRWTRGRWPKSFTKIFLVVVLLKIAT